MTQLRIKTVEDFLQHFGKKGMKWGVRNDKDHVGERAKTRKIAKLDKKFERNVGTFSTTLKLHNAAATMTNKNDIDRINNKPEYKGMDFTRPTPLRDQYYKDLQKAFVDNLERAAKDFGTNASGTKEYKILEKDDGSWDVFTSEIKHADGAAAPTMNIKVSKDANGHITELSVNDPDVKHTFTVDDVLIHFGIKDAPSTDRATVGQTFVDKFFQAKDRAAGS